MKKININYKKRYQLKAVLISCLFLANAFAGYTQENGAFATVDTNKLLIGDQTYLRLTVENRPGFTLEWPVISDSMIKGVEILKRFLPDTINRQKDNFKIQQKFLITSFDSGQHDIPAFRLVFNSTSIHDSIVSNQVSIWVNTMAVDTSKAIFDIKNPYGAPLTLREMLPYIVFGLLAILAILLIVYIVRRLKKQKPLIPARIITEPSHVTALRELDRLKEEKLWQQGMVKPYYTRLTDIIRVYIESRFNVPAMEQTSYEILSSLKKISIEDESSFSALRDILNLADLVKFAKALPLPNENESNILNAYLFVNHTKAVDTLPPPVSNNQDTLIADRKEAGHE